MVTRREAAGLGQRKFLGNPCKYGHAGERYISNGLCVVCQAEKAKRDWVGRKARNALLPPKPRLPRAPKARVLTEEHLSYLQALADGKEVAHEDTRNLRRRIAGRLGARGIIHAVALAIRGELID